MRETWQNRLCNLDYARADFRPKSGMLKDHSHQTWQVEIILGGKALLHSGGRKRGLPEGSVLYIRPGVVHRLEYPGTGVRYLSFRFDLAYDVVGPSVAVVSNSSTARFLTNSLAGIVPRRRWFSGPEKRIVEHLISALMVLYETPESPEGEFSKNIINLVEQDLKGGPRIKSLAQSLGLSPGHLSSRFRKEFGVGLKSYIDQRRAEIARGLVESKEYQIGDVAQEMGFPSLHEFSRFFKRYHGVSPREYRESSVFLTPRK